MTTHQIDSNDTLPLYYQIYISLSRRINTGEFPRGSMLPGWRSLANAYGVSSITVHRALSMLEQEGIIERQRGRGTLVLNPEKESAPHRDQKIIGFYTTALLHPYLYSILMGVTDFTTQHSGYSLRIVGEGDGDGELDIEGKVEARTIERISTDIDGLLVYQRSGHQKLDLYRLYERLEQREFPLVLIDRYDPQIPLDRVVNADEEGAFSLTQALIRRGHRRIALLQHHEIDTTSVRDRIAGYRRALNEANLLYDEQLLWLDLYRSFQPLREERDALYSPDRMLALIEEHRPTAFLAINRDMAMRAELDLQRIGVGRLRAHFPPEKSKTQDLFQIDVAAFTHTKSNKGSGLCRFIWAYQSGAQLGFEAARLLAGRLDGTIQGDPRAIILPVEIVDEIVAA